GGGVGGGGERGVGCGGGGGGGDAGNVFRTPRDKGWENAGKKPTPAALDGVLAAADDRARGPERLWCAWLSVCQRRCGACLGPRLLQRHHQTPAEACRLRDQPQHGVGVVLHVREDRRGGEGARGRRDLLSVRAAILRCVAEPATSGTGHRQHVGRIQQMETGQPACPGTSAARRPDWLSRNHPQKIEALSYLAYRP